MANPSAQCGAPAAPLEPSNSPPRPPAWPWVGELKPEPGQVVIRVGGAGGCHADLQLMHDFEAGALPYGPSFTLGNENAGLVHELDDDVEGPTQASPR